MHFLVMHSYSIRNEKKGRSERKSISAPRRQYQADTNGGDDGGDVSDAVHSVS